MQGGFSERTPANLSGEKMKLYPKESPFLQYVGNLKGPDLWRSLSSVLCTAGILSFLVYAKFKNKFTFVNFAMCLIFNLK